MVETVFDEIEYSVYKQISQIYARRGKIISEVQPGALVNIFFRFKSGIRCLF